ncbi:MAG: helix-turn-helix domain-containing protein [Gemmataceae bacterium]
MTAAWSAPTTPDEVARRAGGRKHYNTWRRWLAFRRRYLEVSRRLFAKGALKRGYQERLARELGVSRATISRDVQYLKRQGHYDCPACGAMVKPSKPHQKCAN